MRIHRLSTVNPEATSKGSAIVMVGSFAPVHSGHFDAIRSASRAIIERSIGVGSIILSPNSDEYLTRKLASKSESLSWQYHRRIEEIVAREAPVEGVHTFVDDITGGYVGLEEINLEVPRTIHHHLGITAERLYFVTGSDQLPSMQAHLTDSENRAVCVLRPGHLNDMQDKLSQSWIAQAIAEGRYIITERDDMVNDVSSTDIRHSREGL